MTSSRAPTAAWGGRCSWPRWTGITLAHFPAAAATFDPSTRMGDGANLYEYLGSNPWHRSDPMGLSWDPFDLVDDYLAESAGSTAAFLSALGKDAKAAVVAATIASWLLFPVVGQAGDLALYALGEQTDGELAVALTLGMVPGGTLGKLLGGIGSSAWKAAKHYASRYALPLAKRVGSEAASLLGRAREFIRRKPGTACGCFAAETFVWTTLGLLPIGDVEPETLVVTRRESDGSFVLARVLAKIETPGAALLEVTVEHDSGAIETIETSYEHPFRVIGTDEDRWVRADLLRPLDRVRTAGGSAVVRTLAFTSQRRTVYNLTVEGSPTYLVGGKGVWVHNCPFRKVFGIIANAIGSTALNGARIVGDSATKSKDIVRHGFTRTVHSMDDLGNERTVFCDPKTKQYDGAHLSSGQP